MLDRIPHTRRGRVICCCVVAVVAALPGCGAPGEGGGEGEGPGRRYQALALSADQEVKLGDEAFQEVLQQERKNVVPDNDPRCERVKEVGKKIFDVALNNKPLRREINLSAADPYGHPWDFNDSDYRVIENKEVNAFCLPGAKVVVFTGLLELAKGDDSWLATVMGHEIAHALAHHASERIARQRMEGQALAVASRGLERVDNDDRLKLLDLLGVGSHATEYDQHWRESDEGQSGGGGGGGIFQQLRDLSFDRQQESEADHIGIFLMAFAGYDPTQAVGFWQAMEAQGGAKPPEILSDHPSDAHRVSLIRLWGSRAQDAYQAYKAGRIAPDAER